MRRNITALIFAACVILSEKPADAHRIDEYLQATILSLESHRVNASMRLIPGILVSPTVIAAVDADADGAFSESEERAYAQRVLDDLTITIDGERVLPKLISWSFPQPAQVRDGLGEIHIEYALDLPSGGQYRSLIVANHHLSGTSVYLMNVLVPQDAGIRILAQKRNDVAMGKLGQAASQLDNKILLYTMDAAKYEFGPARFDLIVLFYHLDRALFPKIVSALNPGGWFICKMPLHWAPESKSEKANLNLLERNEILSLVRGLHVLDHCERPVRDRGVVELVGRRPEHDL